MRIFITGGAGFIGIPISYNSSRPGEIMFSAADISKAKEFLKFNPKISLKRGLEQFLSE